MSNLIPAGLTAFLPRDSRITFSLLVAGTGALALLLEYYYHRDKHGNAGGSVSDETILSKIESGNLKLEAAIQEYELALAEMQAGRCDNSRRMQVRAMLLRAYEIQAILSPDEFNLRSTVMIENVSDQSILQNHLLEIDGAGGEIIPQIESGADQHLQEAASLSSGDLSDFYEAFEMLDERDRSRQGNDNLPLLYKDLLFQHQLKPFTCRKNRYSQFGLNTPSDYLVKVQGIRLAMNELLKDSTKREWMLRVGRDNTAKLLVVAGAKTEDFNLAFNDMLEFISSGDNLTSIREELKARRVASVNVYDIVIDFCLLDSFDDLDAPPASVTSVISNGWISQGLRKSMLSTAVWGMISTKSGKAKPDGFLSKFYKIMGSLTPALAWGFLGDDATLKPICTSIRNNVLTALEKIFDEHQTNYSSLETLAEDLHKALFDCTEDLNRQLELALS